jgi:hypothetical protein
MKPFKTILVGLCIIVTAHNINAQHTYNIQWKELADGIHFCEVDAPVKSIVNDSKLSIVKIDPTKFNFNLMVASEHERQTRTASEWAQEFDFNIVVNLGMYQYDKNFSAKAFCLNEKHINNSRFSGYYNAMIAFHPKNNLNKNQFEIIDLTCKGCDMIKDDYGSYCQAMRMIDCNRIAMKWDKNPSQSCSMAIASTDSDGNIYFIFTRSPYTHQTMIGFLLDLPFQLNTTVYLEGGPEASLYIATPDTTISKFGSYISKSRERDDNSEFWKIPNIIGVCKK